MQCAADHQMFHVIQHGNLPNFVAKRYAGWHASAPILTALALAAIAACVVAAAFVPAALGPIVLAMSILMLGAAALAFFSLVATGQIIEIRFDKSKQLARIFYRGPVAHTEWVVPFARMSGARMAISYDAKGNKIVTPTLDLADGGHITLPQSTTWSDIEAIRDMVQEPADMVAEAWARKVDKRTTGMRVGRH